MRQLYVYSHPRPFRLGVGIARGHVHRLYFDLGYRRVWVGLKP